MKNKNLIFIVLFLMFPINSYADETAVHPVSLDYFLTNEIPKKGIALFIELKEKKQPELKYDGFQYQKEAEDAEKIMSFRARFVIDAEPKQLSSKMFHLSETWDSLSRNTEFTKISEFKFKAKRPSFLFDINWEMEVLLSNGTDNPELVRFFRKHSAIKKSPKLLIFQRMYQYNRFLTSSEFDFAIYPKTEHQLIVEVLGWSGFRDTVPTFLQNQMTNNFTEKMIHFQKALESVLNQP